MEIVDTSLQSWVEVNSGSDFPIQNLPFGILNFGTGGPGAAVPIGDQVLDLAALSALGYLSGIEIPHAAYEQPFLNAIIESGHTSALRARLGMLLARDNAELRDSSEDRAKAMRSLKGLTPMMPVYVRDYTDFYSSIDHATNVGKMFRDPENALLPNWRHMPVGYHGRASSIVASGAHIKRPLGQTKKEDSPPTYGPSRLLDFELEMAFVAGKGTSMGQQIPVDRAEDHIFGLCLFNDLSARDIQKWEYVPLGPFLGKNFGSVISPWIVTLDALEPFRVEGYEQDPPVLPYLRSSGKKNYDIQLEVEIVPANGAGKVVCRSNFRYMYWNMCQQLAHHTVNGCNIQVGDMYASGTISGPDPSSFGSMLELSWRGTKPIDMPDGTTRKFIQDGDTVVMRAWAERDGLRIGFGECRATIEPADHPA